MIALDTNVLLRLLVTDVEVEAVRQRRVAERVIDLAETSGEPLFVSEIVLCEAVWAMRARYRIPRAEIRASLSNLLSTRHLAFDAPARISRALAAFAAGKGDFADYLIREHARAAGCDAVVTFDQALLREDGFRAP